MRVGILLAKEYAPIDVYRTWIAHELSEGDEVYGRHPRENHLVSAARTAGAKAMPVDPFCDKELIDLVDFFVVFGGERGCLDFDTFCVVRDAIINGKSVTIYPRHGYHPHDDV